MQTETINLTALAKFNRGTTPATRTKLEKLGIKPVQEVEMPSGRKFVLFDKVKAIKALEKAKEQRQRERTKKAEQSAKKPVNSDKPRKTAAQAPVGNEAVTQELRELKALTAQLLEAFTKPSNQSST